jgi:hypothetical protein
VLQVIDAIEATEQDVGSEEQPPAAVAPAPGEV